MSDFGNAEAGVSDKVLAGIMAATMDVADAPRNAVFVIYGDPGSGRTTIACGLAQSKALLLTCEKGYTSLQNVPEVSAKTKIIPLQDKNNVSQIRAVVQAINAGQLPEYDVLVIDTLTGIYERKVNESLNNPKHSGYSRQVEDQPGMHDYGYAYTILRPMLLELVQAKCIVVILTHIRYPNEQQIRKGETTRPDLGKAVYQLINEECGIIGKTYRDPRTGKHQIKLQGSNNEVAKAWMGLPADMSQGEFIKAIQKYREGI